MGTQMVRKKTLLISCIMLLLTGASCFFFPSPERTNPFDPASSENILTVTRFSNKLQLKWTAATLDSGTIAYKVITSMVANDIRETAINYTSYSNLKSIVHLTNVKNIGTSSILRNISEFNTNYPNHFVIIYRTPNSAKGSTIATFKP
jgi:hypothetical protein